MHRLNAAPDARLRGQTGRGAAIASRDLGIGRRFACLRSRRLSSPIQASASAIVLKPSIVCREPSAARTAMSNPVRSGLEVMVYVATMP
jgi:hypothetical protein